MKKQKQAAKAAEEAAAAAAKAGAPDSCSDKADISPTQHQTPITISLDKM